MKVWYDARRMYSNPKSAKFLSQFKSVVHKKGEMILRGGDAPQAVYLVKNGYAKLSSISSEGEELTLVIYKAGEFFPVVWTFFGKRASIYSFEALTQVEIVRIPRESFLEFINENRDVFMEIVEHIITRFQSALRRMEYLVFGNSSAKVASMLLILGKNFGEKKAKGMEIQIPLTHKDIANLIGVTRETVSIELKRFEREKLIAYNKKLIILSNEKTLAQRAILS